jgi:hypothetical protein
MVKSLWEFCNGEYSLVCASSKSVNGKSFHYDIVCITDRSSINQVYERTNWCGNIRASLSITERKLPFRALIIYHPFSVPHLSLHFPLSVAGRSVFVIQTCYFNCFYVRYLYSRTNTYSNNVQLVRTKFFKFYIQQARQCIYNFSSVVAFA